MGSRYEVEVTLRPYAGVWVDTAAIAAKRYTRVDEDGDTSPRWGDRLLIAFDFPIEDSTLCVDIFHADAAEDTKPLIGSARLCLRDVVDDAAAERRLELKRPSGRPQGKLEVRVSVREPPPYPAPDPYHAPQFGVPPPGTREYYRPLPYGGPYGGPPAYAAPMRGYFGAYGIPHPIYRHPAYGQGRLSPNIILQIENRVSSSRY
ncbi:calcium-dependent lipid-binding family protein [Striga asiatica]|uniref:Calcium-dependent lipid-binding family protein n=1 Tax=Striga asiatica TaxID=4170 RepID=A0A5A7R0W2_STRAF|nr:calcium-dependent lipid-binding family protein [Striga asiatica]